MSRTAVLAVLLLASVTTAELRASETQGSLPSVNALSIAQAQTLIAQNSTSESEKNSENSENSENLGVLRRSIFIVDDAQRVASERFGSFMGQVDGFFSNAGSDDDALSNESWARIRLDGVVSSNDSFELDPSVKLRAVLPQTERRLKLLFSTEEDDETSVDPGDSLSVNSGGERRNASLALRFIRTTRDRLDVNLDVGVRQRSGSLQTFGRVNTRFNITLENQWLFSFANSYYYYYKSGFEDRLSFDFRRPLNQNLNETLNRRDSLYFRTYSEFNWRKGQKGSVIGQIVGLYWQPSSAKALALEASAGYHTSLNTGVSDRYRGHEVRLRWRQNIWRKWFYYEIWPSLSWPSSNDYRQTQGILLRAEVIIGQR